MISYVKKFIFLIILLFTVVSCGGGDTGSSAKTCNSNSDCEKTQECKFAGKTATSGECVEKQVCQSDSECSDKRACAASLIGTEKYCGGFLSNFSFKDNQKLKSGTVGEEYNETIELMGQTGAFHIIVKAGDSLPDGLMINLNTGDISGTPSKDGEFKFTLVAYNGASDAHNYYNIIKAEKEFSIKINKESVCTPDCSGKDCGDDGCGGSCGTCDSGTCNANGICETTCTPDCSGKDCGDDGCGGSCGTCDNGTCNANGICETTCTPDCSGKDCGDDGCGGSCGTCDNGTCNANGQCETACVPDCNNKVCGDDGCGGSCGTCNAGETCNDSGQCEAGCVPSCDGKSCGDDGCGDVCGLCADTGETCNENYTCETTTIAGSLVITEFMPNPSGSDSNREWIEIYNTTDNAIDLTDLKILKDSTSKSITSFTSGNEIQPHSYFVIAKKDAATSGLPNVDAISAFSLTNSGTHTITIKINSEIIDSISYTSSSDGKSWQVDPALKDHDLNDYSFAWCKGSTEISADNTDKGTPGAENQDCSSK